jgi:hypothetical protein
MPESAGVDWIWLANGAIDEFKQSRIRAGATSASASSYATGARAFVRHCRTADQHPSDAIKTFHTYLAQTSDLSGRARSHYESYARAFVQFLRDRPGSQHRSRQYPEVSSSRDAATGVVTSPLAGDALERTVTAGKPTASEIAAPPWLDSMDGASTAQLLAAYAKTLEVLRARGIVRTANAPSGDFAEWLVWRAFGGRIEPNSTKSHDVTDALGRKLQVKVRLVSHKLTPGQLQTSVFRSWAFDFAVLIQLAEGDYSVVRASMVPVHLFDEGRANANWSEHVKGWAVFMTPALMGHAEAVDVTANLRVAAGEG